MCGRFTGMTIEQIDRVISDIIMQNTNNLYPDWPAQKTLHSVFPKQDIPLIIPNFDTATPPVNLETHDLRGVEFRWGFEFPWSKQVIFNTRFDSIHKPTWEDSVVHRRCLIPCFTFFEPHKDEKSLSSKTHKPITRQYEFKSDAPYMLLGGIYKDNQFSVVTTEPNADVSLIHGRMPIVMSIEEAPLWFSNDWNELKNRDQFELWSRALTPLYTEPEE